VAGEIPEPAAESTPLTAFRCGLLHALGAFGTGDLTGEELIGITGKKSWFWFGEVVMAGILAGLIAVPAGMLFAGMTEAPLAAIGAVLIFLALFIFLPKILRWATGIDAGAAIDAFGKNEHLKKVFWTLFLAVAALVLARIADPETAQKVIGLLAGAGT
jgi:hypothetical protein